MMSNNSESWNTSDVVSYFDSNRINIDDIYPSEYFFLENVLHENVKILDIGCAQGGFSHAIGQKLSNFSYTGVDISENMIKQAKINYPQHNFYHIEENDDYAILDSNGDDECFDITLVLGILHLHETWRETIKKAWSKTSSIMILDLRVVSEETIEDKEKSYFKMNFNGDKSDYSRVLPYNLINSSEALSTIQSLCAEAKKISFFGYSQAVSASAVCPVDNVFANVYCIER